MGELNLDLRTIFLMDAALYLMLHGAIWIGLARHRSGLVALWSLSGMLSAVGLVLLGMRGVLPDWTAALLGQLFMALGNWGRQGALHAMVGGPTRPWLWRQGLFNLAYLALNTGLFLMQASEWLMVLVFYAFYSFNLAEYFRIGRVMRRSGVEHGALAIEAAGAAFCTSLGIKTLALAGGWGEVDLYTMAWDQVVVFVGQFVAISLVNVGFIQAFVGEMDKARLRAEQDLLLQRQKSDLLEQHAQDLGALLSEREEIIRQLTLSNKTAGMGALVASIAHEINQPLTTVVLKAELIDSMLEQSTELGEARKLSGQIREDTQRVGSIIRTLRSMFTMGKGQFEKLDFSLLMQDLLTIVRGRAERLGVRLQADVQAQLMVTGDATQLQQVVLNLLNNALDAVSESGVQAPCIQVRCWLQDGQVLLRVQDNGCGIDPAHQGDVFQLFKTSKPKGMGVGLWLSQAIVQSHGGQLDFESTPGQGTVFELRLSIHDERLVL